MKKALWILGVSFTSGLFLLPTYSYADLTQNFTHDTQVSPTLTDSNITFYAGTTTSEIQISKISVWVGNSSGNPGALVSLRVNCYANSFTTSQAGCTTTQWIADQSYSVAAVAGGQQYTFTFGSGFTFPSGKVMLLEILLPGPSGSRGPVYGQSTLQFNNQCTFVGTGTTDCTGAPYFTFNTGINWGAISFPLVFSTSSLAIATSSTAWANINIASSTTQCDVGGIFASGICTAAAFLFMPNPDVLNGYVQLASTTLPGKFPFSWYYGIKNAFDGLTASSSANMATLSIDFSSVDPATTTPFGAILPNATLLSSSTITTYLSQSMLDLILALEAAAIWLLFAMYIFHDVQNSWLKK